VLKRVPQNLLRTALWRPFFSPNFRGISGFKTHVELPTAYEYLPVTDRTHRTGSASFLVSNLEAVANHKIAKKQSLDLVQTFLLLLLLFLLLSQKPSRLAPSILAAL
jgi:hypothetical protein